MKHILISNGKNSDRYSFIADYITIIPSQDIDDIQVFYDLYLKDKEEYVIYIPTIRTNDSALAYSGVTLSLWVYMYMLLTKNLKFHIVLLGTETKGAFFEHCNYARLILAPNVHYVQNSKQAIEYFIEHTDTSLYPDCNTLIQAIKGVYVEPPTAFKNAHTITNEWCIYRWSKALGIDVPNNGIDKSLYFTYLKTILSINDIPKVQNKCSATNKVLVVDDEMGKGWRVFFEALLPNHVHCIGEDFKKARSRDEIIQQAKAEIIEYDPDIVILDLRLHDSDHNNNKNDKLTGIKVLEEIKKINKGIQVIGFTASNKAWNLLAWQELGINGFIIKEAPEKSVELGYTERSITQLMNEIENAASKAYLKGVYKTNHAAMDKLRELSNKKNRILDKEVVDATIGYLKLAQSSLFAANPNHDTAFMYYFLIMEAFSKLMIEEDGELGVDKLYYFRFRRDRSYLMEYDKHTGKNTQKKLTGGKVSDNQHIRIPYDQKFYNMINYVGIQEIDPINLVKIRNDFNHPDFFKPIGITYQNVLDMMNVVCSLINNYR